MTVNPLDFRQTRLEEENSEDYKPNAGLWFPTILSFCRHMFQVSIQVDALRLRSK